MHRIKSGSIAGTFVPAELRSAFVELQSEFPLPTGQVPRLKSTSRFKFPTFRKLKDSQQIRCRILNGTFKNQRERQAPVDEA